MKNAIVFVFLVTGLSYGQAFRQQFIDSADNRSWTITADLADKKCQILMSNNFGNPDGTRLQPYLIEFQTANA